MKKSIYIIVVSALLAMCNCTGNEPADIDNGGTYQLDGSAGLLTRSSAEMPPFIPNSIYFENGDTLMSENSIYKAKNISFSSEEVILARPSLSGGVFGDAVEVWHNLVEVENKSTGNRSKFFVSLIPDAEYYARHKFIDWNSFKHLDKNSDFSGFEIRTDCSTGDIFFAGYNYHGQNLYHVEATDDVKIDFIKSILNQFEFERISLIKLLAGVDDEDHEDPSPNPGDNGNDGNKGSGDGVSGGGHPTTNYTITGNETLFKKDIISSFPEHDFESSPCAILSFALLHYNIHKSPAVILNEAKAANNGKTLSVYKNKFIPEDVVKVIRLNFSYKRCEDIRTSIENGHSVFSAYNPTGSPNYTCAILIIGYIGDDIIFYHPENNHLRIGKAGIFDMDETFELISPLL